MSNFMSFNSFEAMQEFLAAQEDAANLKVSSAQRELCDGNEHWFVRPVDYSGELLMIFGHIPSLASTIAKELSFYGEEMDEEEQEEHDWTVAHLKSKLNRGYVFSNCFSTVEPNGELGDTHVSSVIPIPEVMFEQAQKLNWNVTVDEDGNEF